MDCNNKNCNGIRVQSVLKVRMKIAVAMSGGVDSTVAALLLRAQGKYVCIELASSSSSRH